MKDPQEFVDEIKKDCAEALLKGEKDVVYDAATLLVYLFDNFS